MRVAFIVVGLLNFLSGCRSADVVGSTKEVVTGDRAAKLVCSFVSPFQSGDKFNAWISPTAKGNIKDIEFVQSVRGQEAAKETLVGVLEVGKSAVTDQGRRQLRSCSKAIVNVDFEKFECYGLESDRARASFLCVARNQDSIKTTGTRSAFWATNLSPRRYKNELTIYESTCRENEL